MQTLARLRKAAAEREEKERQERERVERMRKEREEREERERAERETKERRERERAAAKMERATRGMRGNVIYSIVVSLLFLFYSPPTFLYILGVYRGRVQAGAASGRGGTSAIPARTGTTGKRL